MPTAVAFEILESPDEGARFCIAYSDTNCTVGMVILKSDSELPKHQWIKAAKLLQVGGQCALTITSKADEITARHELAPGNSMLLPAEAWHILTNTGDEESLTLFKIAGDVTPMLEQLRKDYTAIDLETA